MKKENHDLKNLIKQKINFQIGFTLVELLIYMGIFMVLFTTITFIFTTVIDAKIESESYSGIQQDGRFIIARLVYDIHRASSIMTPAFQQQGNSLQLVINGEIYTYSLDGDSNLTVTYGGNTYKLNSFDTSISNLSFEQIGNFVNGKNTVRISFTVASRVMRKGAFEEKQFTTTIGIRWKE